MKSKESFLKLKNEAAKVIQQISFVYKYKKITPDISKCRSHQRKLLEAIDKYLIYKFPMWNSLLFKVYLKKVQRTLK